MKSISFAITILIIQIDIDDLICDVNKIMIIMIYMREIHKNVIVIFNEIVELNLIS